MFDWLTNLIPFGLGTVDKLTGAARNLAATLWSALVSFFTEQMNAAAYVSREGANVAAQVGALGLALYKLGFFILSVAFPRWAGAVTDQVTQWAAQQIANVRRDLTSFVADVRAWAANEISAIRSDITSWINDTRAIIGDVVSVLNWVRDRVEQLLTDPTILAQWLLVPLWTVAKQWVESNSEALAKWALGVAVRGTLGAAAFIEDIILAIF